MRNIIEKTKNGNTLVELDDKGVLTISPISNTDGRIENNDLCSDKNKVTKIYVNSGVKASKDSSLLFFGYKNLIEADINNLDFSEVEDAYSLFAFCKQLEQVKLEDLDVSNVKEFAEMFAYCKQLRKLDVSKWNIKKAESLYAMFYGTEKLKKINIDNWNSKYLTDVDFIFKQSKINNKKRITKKIETLRK